MQPIEKIAEEMSARFESQLRIKGKSLAQQVAKAAPQLPKSVRKDAEVVLSALNSIGNPKLERMLDDRAATLAAQNVIAHLDTIDPWDRLKGRILNWLGAISAFGILLFVILIWVAVKRGLI